MADRTWTVRRGESLNVVVGCTPASSGCDNCAAACQVERLARAPLTKKRYQGFTKADQDKGFVWTGKVEFRPQELAKIKKKHGKVIWVCSMADLFHADITLEQIAEVYAAFYEVPDNVYQILTKRAARMHKLYTDGSLKAAVEERLGHEIAWPPPNTWEGVSVEDQKTARSRIKLLLKTPSNFRFVSFQPLLEEIDLGTILPPNGLHYAVLGTEAGPTSRYTPPDAVINLRQQLVDRNIPQLTESYPL